MDTVCMSSGRCICRNPAMVCYMYSIAQCDVHDAGIRTLAAAMSRRRLLTALNASSACFAAVSRGTGSMHPPIHSLAV